MTMAMVTMVIVLVLVMVVVGRKPRCSGAAPWSRPVVGACGE